MVRKLTFGIVFLLCISFVFAATVSETGYFGNYQQNVWSSLNSIEIFTFVGGDNLTSYVNVPKHSNVISTELQLSSNDNLSNFTLEIGTPDGIYEAGFKFDELVNITNDYYVIIEADLVNELTYESIGDSNIEKIGDKKYLFWINGTSGYEINRAIMMERLFSSDWFSSTYVTGIKSIKTKDNRDIGKRGFRLTCYGEETGSGTCTFGRTITFVNTTDNYNMSSWSQTIDTGGNAYYQISSVTKNSGNNDEYSTNTVLDQEDNPTNIVCSIQAEDWGGRNHVNAIALIHGNSTSSGGGSCPQQGASEVDYVDDKGMVAFTELTDSDLAFNGEENISNFSLTINNYLTTCTADGIGYCYVPFTFYSDSAGILNADIGNTINYSLLYNFTYEDITFENEENTYTLDVYSIDPLQVDSTFYFNNTGYSPSSFSYETGYKTMSYTMVTPFIGEGITFTAPLYWEVDDNGNISNTSTYNQTVNKINLADCETETNWTKVLDIYTLDEEGNDSDYVTTTINFNANIWYEDESSPQNYSFQFKDAHNYSLCIFPNSTGYVNAIMEYFADGYSNRKYYLDNFSLDYENSQTLNLYNLNSSKSSDVTLYVYDRNTGESIEGAYVKLLRYYPETNKYRIVEIEKTDSNGYSLGKMVVADVFYKFIVEYERDVVYNGAVERIVSLTKQIPVIISGDLLESWRSIDDISGSVTCTESTKTCRFTWSDSSNLVQTASMKVYRVNGYGKTSIVELSSSAVSGSLVYTISENTTGNEYIAVGYIHTNTANSFYTMGEDFIEFRESISDQFGVGALFPMFLLLVVMGAVLLNTGAVGVIVGSLIAIVGGTLIGIIPFGVTTILSFVIMGAILIGKLKS